MRDERQMTEVKQVIVIRRDLKMRRGKEIAQGAHAAMGWLARKLADEESWRGRVRGQGHQTSLCMARLTDAEQAWLDGSFRKITVQVHSEQEIRDLHKEASDAGLSSVLITDAGLTEFAGIPTVTALAIGPDYDDKIDVITGSLELY